MTKSKVTEVTITVGQTIQLKRFEPRDYQATVKMTVDPSENYEDVLKEAREIANNEVKGYFSDLLTPKEEPYKSHVIAVSNEIKPQILCQPNIPKPLHGIAPRTIKGDTWWNKTRQEVYAKTDYHCVACGVAKDKAKGHKWLEAHEYWNIDYTNGICKIDSIEPLCHYCHNFIHSGRLSKILGNEKSETEVKEILEHGFKVLSNDKLTCFPETLELAKNLGVDTHGVKAYAMPTSDVKWEDWKLVFEGKEYKSKFKNIEEWQEFYDKLNNKE